MTDFAPHPGEVLPEDFLKPLGMSLYPLAKAIDMARDQVGPAIEAKVHPRAA